MLHFGGFHCAMSIGRCQFTARHRALKSALMAVVAAAVVVVGVVAAWVLLQLLRKSISTWSVSSLNYPLRARNFARRRCWRLSLGVIREPRHATVAHSDIQILPLTPECTRGGRW